MPQVITKLMGGLGNQMFQYAIGRALSLKRNASLKIDLSYLNSINPVHSTRQYNLDVFPVKASIATGDECDPFYSMKENSLHHYIPFLFSHHYLREKNFYFDASLLKRGGNIYLDGFWQSYRYFDEIWDVICSDFIWNEPLTIENKKLASEISTLDSVSIHVRRGDYITNPITHQFHGVCELQYYQEAIRLISARIKAPVFYVFSDDMLWVKENLKCNFPIHFVENNAQNNSHEDMRLMSFCKHNIIANSSFSWWGAWLNENREKIVISPRYWFSDKNIHTRDLLPENWIKI